jgi:dienelactone hydrolase
VTPSDSATNITTVDWPYRDEDTALTGVLCRDEALPGLRPGILLVHGGAGLDQHALGQARRYAALGYVVFACDMLGDGVAGDRNRVVGCLTALRDDPPAMVRRARAGLTALSRCPGAGGPVAAIGFCFGGMVVLTLARSGEPMAGAVSIHGSLATTARVEPGTVLARLLVCHGALDPYVPLSDVTAFAEEMNTAGADWQLIMYGGALHGFTHAEATPGAAPGVAYHQLADSRSFAATRDFLTSVFAPVRQRPIALWRAKWRCCRGRAAAPRTASRHTLMGYTARIGCTLRPRAGTKYTQSRPDVQRSPASRIPSPSMRGDM